jgi:hypothetical protein
MPGLRLGGRLESYFRHNPERSLHSTLSKNWSWNSVVGWEKLRQGTSGTNPFYTASNIMIIQKVSYSIRSGIETIIYCISAQDYISWSVRVLRSSICVCNDHISRDSVHVFVTLNVQLRARNRTEGMSEQTQMSSRLNKTSMKLMMSLYLWQKLYHLESATIYFGSLLKLLSLNPCVALSVVKLLCSQPKLWRVL